MQNLTKKFGDLLVLDNLNFEVEEGEFLCIVGPTGCGKTTFLNSLTRLYEPTAGEILVNGIPVDPKKQNISYIFQEYSSFPWLTVEQTSPMTSFRLRARISASVWRSRKCPRQRRMPM